MTLYRSAGCHLCDEAEVLVQDELALRSSAGQRVPILARVDISTDAELEARYRPRIPVLAIGDDEVDLVITQRQVRELLDRAVVVPGR
jgi:hypothetical protein